MNFSEALEHLKNGKKVKRYRERDYYEKVSSCCDIWKFSWTQEKYKNAFFDGQDVLSDDWEIVE